jgi:hypothetical protein
MIGGVIIERRTMTVRFSDGESRELVRLWVIGVYENDGQELAVYVEPTNPMPAIGTKVWWQGRKVYFNGDRNWLYRVGCSFDPRPSERHMTK